MEQTKRENEKRKRKRESEKEENEVNRGIVMIHLFFFFKNIFWDTTIFIESPLLQARVAVSWSS